MKNGSSGCGKNRDCEYHHPKMCRYESKCNSLQCKYLHPKTRQQITPVVTTVNQDQTNVITAPLQTQGAQGGATTVVSTIPTNTTTINNSATATTNNGLTIATGNQSENPQNQVFHQVTTGPDISQILASLQNAIQNMTNDIKELKADKQQQQLQQQQQQQHQQWAPQIYYSQ